MYAVDIVRKLEVNKKSNLCSVCPEGTPAFLAFLDFDFYLIHKTMSLIPYK